MQHYRL